MQTGFVQMADSAGRNGQNEHRAGGGWKLIGDGIHQFHWGAVPVGCYRQDCQ